MNRWVVLLISVCNILVLFRAQKHPFERVTTPYQVYSWLAPVQEHTMDSIRAEEGIVTFSLLSLHDMLLHSKCVICCVLSEFSCILLSLFSLKV